MIWRAAISPPRLVFPEVIVDHSHSKEQDLEDYEYVLWQGWEPDEHARTIAAVDEELNEQVRLGYRSRRRRCPYVVHGEDSSL